MNNMAFDGAQVDGLERLSADGDAHRFDRHSHDEYSIILVTEGRKKLSVENRTEQVQRGQVVIVPPGASHECEAISGEDWGFRAWYLSPDIVAEQLENAAFASKPPRLRNVLSDQALTQSLIKLHEAGNEGQVTDREQVICLGETILSASRERTDVSQISAGARYRMGAYTETLLADPALLPDIEALADAAQVSRGQVIRDIKQARHMTPRQLINDIRLRRSKQLLRSSMSLSQISAEVGFSDQSHFNRKFRQAYGVTPGRYRDEVLV